jgi:hypothetical protein
MKPGEIVIEKANGEKDFFEARPVTHGILQHLELKIDCNGNIAVWKHHKLVKQYTTQDVTNIAISDREDSSFLIEVKA